MYFLTTENTEFTENFLKDFSVSSVLSVVKILGRDTQLFSNLEGLYPLIYGKVRLVCWTLIQRSSVNSSSAACPPKRP